FSHNTNRVTELYLGNSIPYGNFGQFNISVGHDLQEYYLPLWAGVNPDDGTPLWYTDETHTKTTNDYNEAQPSFTNKSASPKYFGSFTNTFTYKQLSLQVMF